MQGGINRNSPPVKNKRMHGFTIVETMIVLAVTGMLFFSVITVMAGRQNKAQFQQSINTVKTELEQTISQVQTGYYPSTQNFKCAVGGSGNLSITSVAAGNEQGTNKDCVFFGRAIQLKINGEDRYATLPLAGLREATTFGASKAKVVPQVVETKMLQFGLEPQWARSSGANFGAIGFVTTLDGISERGTQSIQVLPVPSSVLDQTLDATASVIDANVSAAVPSNKMQICYKSGVSDQHGIISISGGGAVSLKIDNGDCPS